MVLSSDPVKTDIDLTNGGLAVSLPQPHNPYEMLHLCTALSFRDIRRKGRDKEKYEGLASNRMQGSNSGRIVSKTFNLC